ncbi:MAG: GAF domain-containing protein [Mucilaginibacter sp.]|nr:GAF domain-containing protein [Mucilaginibacter sp.]
MFLQFTDKPFRLQLSFHKIIEGLEETAKTDTGQNSQNAKALVARVNQHPELRNGITSEDQIIENADLIADLLADLFPKVLALNEIKAVSIPYQGLIFNHSERFKNILKDAGPDFEINIRDFDDMQLYVLSCCMILARIYGTMLDFSKPMFYDIPTKNGVIKHYRILYNADFIEVFATDEAPKLTPDDIDELMDNYSDIELWKKKFPIGSYVIKGFGLMTLVDVTVENALSTLKSNLLSDYTSPQIKESLIAIFRSMYGIPDLRMGFTLFNQNQDKFMSVKFGPDMQSFLLPALEACDTNEILCGESYQLIVKQHTYFAVSNVDTYIKQNPDSSLGEHFKNQDIQSFILAPVIKDDVLLGILELVSPRPRELNSVTANKLEIVMPFLVDTVDRKMHELENRVRSVIQSYYTTLHRSVYWKFKREAQNYIQNVDAGLTYALKEIKFKEVYPLYGQVDISESSITRNLSVSNDLRNQLNHLISILKELSKAENELPVKELLFDLKTFATEMTTSIRANTEQFIQHYVEDNVHPILTAANPGKTLQAKIDHYFEHINELTGEFHTNRRNYDKTLSLINQKLAGILDRRQAEIQELFPHYYERFKTDGVEHNMYIGATIAPDKEFTMADLHRLRLWQLRVIAEMEVEQFDLKSVLPYQLGVTSLILVFSTPIAIRFRMDEKHFDVDGAYNIRYEVIKKRIDKAHINGSDERITKQGKITIIYSKAEEEQEYLGYTTILQKAGVLADDVEHFEVEELQGVAGLKALRVGLIHSPELLLQRGRPYDDLYKQLN